MKRLCFLYCKYFQVLKKYFLILMCRLRYDLNGIEIPKPIHRETCSIDYVGVYIFTLNKGKT